MRQWIAIWVGRLVGWLSRWTGRGGSSYPGVIARRIDPAILTRQARRLRRGALLITGTNGKTTTAAMLRHLMQQGGFQVVANQAGANLIAGITATFVQFRGLADWALLETDEATMPRASQEIEPAAILVTNFFRDQLDRYGELSTTVQYVRRGIENMGPRGQLVLNADDPQVAFLGHARSDVVYYGFTGVPETSPDQGYEAVDARFCPACGHPLTYRVRYYAHLGDYFCEACGWQRPEATVGVEFWDRTSRIARVRVGDVRQEIPWRLPGLYNLYNEAAALAAGWALGMEAQAMAEHLASFSAAFGRMEWLQIGHRDIWLALVKNPVGFDQVLRTVAEESQPMDVLIVINDRYADGRDVSWLWDVDFERWVPQMPVRQWWVSGIRAWDMAVRLKYAGVTPRAVRVVESPAAAMAAAVSEGEGPLFVLPTYTAMLEVRQYLTAQGHVRHFREG
ncbi:UDP-N-acetylmuramyl tripeptide synthase [Sulfobacillus acidophilus TPY]|uniref:Lipid II isoglutaminyl synthase (glutamine-hydrolyzing) subunit MurT n=1 Tax=Sulfobacillus acidophilus (strain ATCC 700253 / DSM 10332 / NAL) TaxID=679936 RepID=G8TXS1_SULAD|nr:UDP-N-acetylmuramyl tripeptide synthase [Sulfobacillus acidophilus TPY]AEW05027.1 protein of unknown function DUF1727 [Sulfobacillus acidophilus DSM 10332]